MRSARARSYALGVTLVGLAFGSSAQAFETAGKFGVGYDADLNGINLRYFANRVGIDLTWGLALQSPRRDGEETRVDMIFVPRLVYALKMHEKINLNTGGGLTFEVLGSNASDDTDFSLGLFGGLGPEILLWDHLAVEVFFGAALKINNLAENQAQKVNISFGTLGQQLSIVSGATFRYYF
ncbi:MAG: hypothetical protein IPG96_12545 [Proteobacteria bacterium]|nr:hypothetical protein [Pseudomonadota bacterium]